MWQTGRAACPTGSAPTPTDTWHTCTPRARSTERRTRNLRIPHAQPADQEIARGASRCRCLGLINQVVASGTALEAAKALAAKIAANGPLAVALSKQVVAKAQDWDSAAMFSEQQNVLKPIFTSEDAIEGATAFAEKRAPNWKGK